MFFPDESHCIFQCARSLCTVFGDPITSASCNLHTLATLRGSRMTNVKSETVKASKMSRSNVHNIRPFSQVQNLACFPINRSKLSGSVSFTCKLDKPTETEATTLTQTKLYFAINQNTDETHFREFQMIMKMISFACL